MQRLWSILAYVSLTLIVWGIVSLGVYTLNLRHDFAHLQKDYDHALKVVDSVGWWQNQIEGLAQHTPALLMLAPLFPGSALLTMYWESREQAVLVVLPPAWTLPPTFDAGPLVGWALKQGADLSAHPTIGLGGGNYTLETPILIPSRLHGVTLDGSGGAFQMTGPGPVLQIGHAPPPPATPSALDAYDVTPRGCFASVDPEGPPGNLGTRCTEGCTYAGCTPLPAEKE